MVRQPSPRLVGQPAPTNAGPVPAAGGIGAPIRIYRGLPCPARRTVEVNPGAVGVHLGGLAGILGIDILRTPAGADAPSGLNPSGKIVPVGQAALDRRNPTSTDFGRGSRPQGDTTRRRNGLGEAFPDLDPQTTGPQNFDSEDSRSLKVYRFRSTVDSGRVQLLDGCRQLQHHRAVGKKEDRAITSSIPTEGHRIQRNGCVLIHPHHGPVSQNDLQSRLASGVQSVSAHQRHIYNGFKSFFASGRKDGCVAFQIGDVAQRGRIVLNRGHSHQGCHQ